MEHGMIEMDPLHHLLSNILLVQLSLHQKVEDQVVKEFHNNIINESKEFDFTLKECGFKLF